MSLKGTSVMAIKKAPATALNSAVTSTLLSSSSPPLTTATYVVFNVFYMLELEFSPMEGGCQYFGKTVPFLPYGFMPSLQA